MKMYGLRGFLLLMSFPFLNGECLPSDSVCEFNLNIDFKQTMVDQNNKLVYLNNGSLYRYDVTQPDPSVSVPVDQVITADGYYIPNLIVIINGEMPGPTISVYEGQTVRVQVTNSLSGNVISIHWHGITQRGTPWMDGAGFVTQCPIHPGQTFAYEFLADSAGTYFYHNHVGSLRISGLYGAFIVKERNMRLMNEHIVMIAEYNHDLSGDMQLEKNAFGDYMTGKPFETVSIDGLTLSKVIIQSVLINGRGRYIDSNGVSNDAPLTVFEVKPGEQYRFRVIGAGYGFPFRVSVDNHTLLLVAADGHDIESVEVQSFLINNGERFDFIMVADQPPDNYLLRAETFESNPLHDGPAIIRYTGVAPGFPKSQRNNCTADKNCNIANCVFPKFPGEQHSRCIHLSDIDVKGDINAIGADTPDTQIKEYFLNFNSVRGPSINSRRMVLPTVSALTQPSEVNNLCEPEKCDVFCKCTNTITIKHNEIVQLTLLAHGVRKSGIHSVHLHGHRFQVLKIGNYVQNMTTRFYASENTDIACNNDACNTPSWSNISWRANSIPGLKLRNPVYKDTISINSGSYAVVRFRADNPGLWLLHCHMELHMLAGMAMMFNESFTDLPNAPEDFPECRSFPSPGSGVNGTPLKCSNESNGETGAVDNIESVTLGRYWTAVGILIGVAVAEFLVILVFCFRNMSSSAIVKLN